GERSAEASHRGPEGGGGDDADEHTQNPTAAMQGDDSGRVGPDAEECDVSEVQESGHTGLKVQADGEQAVNRGDGDEIKEEVKHGDHSCRRCPPAAAAARGSTPGSPRRGGS